MSTALDLSNPRPAAERKDEKKKSFAELVRAKVSTVLVGKKADQFVTDIISLMNQDPALQKCEPVSLVGAGLQAQSLDLSLNKAMGQAWIIPFKDNKNKVPDSMTGEMVPRVLATFQIGYKGYLQLAMRSGYYRKINVIAIKEGELKRYDPLNEDIEVALIQDVMERHQTPTIGYYCMFEYLNGFRKCMYWPKELMLIHADRYSPAFSLNATNGKYPKVSFADFEAGKVRDADMWKYSSFWYKDFDGMAYKTMLRQILTKWGIMSVEMRQAYDADTRIFQENGDMGEFMDTVDFADGQPVIDTEAEEPDAPPAVPEPKKKTVTGDAPAAPESAPDSKEIKCPIHDTIVRTGFECAKCEHKKNNACPYWATE